MTQKMLPCPFCGTTDPQTKKWWINDGIWFSVECQGCFARGPEGRDRYAAVVKWNKRDMIGKDRP